MPKYYVSCKDVDLYIVIARDNAEKAATDAVKRFKSLHPEVEIKKGVVSVSEKGMLKADSGTFGITRLINHERNSDA